MFCLPSVAALAVPLPLLLLFLYLRHFCNGVSIAVQQHAQSLPCPPRFDSCFDLASFDLTSTSLKHKESELHAQDNVSPNIKQHTEG